jgi:hypothetical protein
VSDNRPINGWSEVEVSRKAVDSHDAEFDAWKYDVMTGWLDAMSVESNMATYGDVNSAVAWGTSNIVTYEVSKKDSTKYASKFPDPYALKFAILLKLDQILRLPSRCCIILGYDELAVGIASASTPL